MKIIAIIQARMGSSRLPGKILKPIREFDNLTYVTERCKKIQGVSDVVVATSTLPQDDAVEQWCKEHQMPFYRGSEEDVLDRFVQCAKPYSPDYVIRVTADCPFMDYEMASEIVSLMHEKQVDIIDLSGELPRGLAIEIISLKALQYIHEHGHEGRHREHVTYYAYEFKDEFSRATYQVPEDRKHPEFRITLDTEEDYKLISKIGQHFNNIFVSSVDVIKFLIENPEVAKINAHIEQKPVI